MRSIFTDYSQNPLSSFSKVCTSTKIWWRINEPSSHQTLNTCRLEIPPPLPLHQPPPPPPPPPHRPFTKLWGRKDEFSSPNSYGVPTNLLTLGKYRRIFLTPDSGNLSTRPIFAKLLWRIDEPSSPNSGGVSTNLPHTRLWKPVD